MVEFDSQVIIVRNTMYVLIAWVQISLSYTVVAFCKTTTVHEREIGNCAVLPLMFDLTGA